MTKSETIEFDTSGDGAIVDLTAEVVGIVAASGIANGIVSICATGSTAAITTLEYEPGLQKDLPELMQRLIPSGVPYEHDATWGDGNGYAHLRSALIGTSFTTAIVEGRPTLGTWQQIVFLEFDNRPRNRLVRVQIVGDS